MDIIVIRISKLSAEYRFQCPYVTVEDRERQGRDQPLENLSVGLDFNENVI